jgi:N-acetylglucosamine-6-phosphate deacetylase
VRAPGFIDLQVNGYGGVDFHDPETSVENILECAELLAAKGTAGFLATVTSSPKDQIEHCVHTIRTAIQRQGNDGNILGIHLEGPFISSEYGFRGAHPEHAICPPDLEWFRELQRIADGLLRIVTLAPEHKNAIEFIRAVAPEVVVAVGHSNCSFEVIRNATEAGLSMATHIGNGCRQTIDRHNNPIFNILGCREISLSFIPDGFHLPEAFIRMIVNCRLIEKLIVVSDSVMNAGMEPGEYENASGIRVVLGNDERLCLASDPEVMAGSSFNMIQCMNHLASLKILSEQELYQLGYVNPLKVLRIDPEKFSEQKTRIKYNSNLIKFELIN